jgi:hypothetical protein
MDVGIRSPFLDFFRRGEVAKDVRMLAARGALAPRAHEQIALLVLLTEDGDSEVRGTAEATLAQIPNASLAAFLGRPDAPDALREFFRGRGIEPDAAAAMESDEPLIDSDTGGEGQEASAGGEAAEGEEGEGERQGAAQRLALMNVAERMKCAMKGTKEERAVLVRDPNKLVSVSVLSSPKLTESEVENFSKLANVSEEVLRIIGTNRGWTKNYGVIAALARNPKTPLGISMKFVQRLTERDLKMMALDRNLQEALKVVVRKRLVTGDDKR